MAISSTHTDLQNPLDRDTAVAVPGVTIVNASAGSGKTHILTLRLIQFLLSPHIQRNGLRNILAITFTRNAAAEMKQRVLEYLKRLALGERERLDEFSQILSLEPGTLRVEAARLLDEIFDRYSDFQLQTIDSFMTSVFKAAAPELGFPPHFNVILTNAAIINQAFEQYLRSLDPAVPEEAMPLSEIVSALGLTRKADQSFAWNPYATIGDKLGALYTEIGAQTLPLKSSGLSGLSLLRASLQKSVADLGALASQSSSAGLEIPSRFAELLKEVARGNIDYLLNHALGPILKKPTKKADRDLYDRVMTNAETTITEIESLLAAYAMAKARSQVVPYSKTLEILKASLESVARRGNTVLLEDVHAVLQRRLRLEDIPEVYFTLGETIFHFLIDEFQDTSPVQWWNIRLLVENTLASEGTLFLVGDTKQSIYGFRGADWTIMERLSHDREFPSAVLELRNLETNYRSGEHILNFVREVFQEIIPATEFGSAASRSGLSSFVQDVHKTHKGKGHVEVHRFNSEAMGESPERETVIQLVEDLIGRGYRLGDIAILTPANAKVIEVSGWLSGARISVISQSSLDVRRRKSAGEILGLLQFLDSPIDDLAFAQWILGDLFAATLRKDGIEARGLELLGLFEQAGVDGEEPAYIRFRRKHPDLWERYFERLYALVGYLPLYDLASAVMKEFSLFAAAPGEEATLTKLLETARQFEGTGQNSLKDFLRAAEEEEEGEQWEIKVPEDIDAVTVMTIHKSKGLQFPAVLVLLKDKAERGREYYIADDGESVELLSINKDLASKNAGLQEIYNAAREKERVNTLNGLYVAFTRAQQELHVLSVYKKEPKISGSFLPQTGYEPRQRPTYSPGSQEAVQTAQHVHALTHAAQMPARPQRFSQADVRRGEMLHGILAAIKFVEPDFTTQLASILERLQVEPAERRTLESLIREFLELPAIQPLFAAAPGRQVLVEQELVTHSGLLYRADRIIVQENKVVVVDFKTGSALEAESHDMQVRNYTSILRGIYPAAAVEGVVAYIDLKMVRGVQ